MELILTGVPSTASEMVQLGVVNRAVLPGEDVLEETLKIARRIASLSAPAVALAKQAVLAGKYTPDPEREACRTDASKAETTTLKAGLEIERALYYSSFSLADCREGVSAFREKRKASVQHR
jgi:enoyl-CoA hydratase